MADNVSTILHEAAAPLYCLITISFWRRASINGHFLRPFPFSDTTVVAPAAGDRAAWRASQKWLRRTSRLRPRHSVTPVWLPGQQSGWPDRPKVCGLGGFARPRTPLQRLAEQFPPPSRVRGSCAVGRPTAFHGEENRTRHNERLDAAPGACPSQRTRQKVVDRHILSLTLKFGQNGVRVNLPTG